jgi:hypothetical protein
MGIPPEELADHRTGSKWFLLKLKTVFNFREAAYYTGDIVVNIPEKTRV